MPFGIWIHEQESKVDMTQYAGKESNYLKAGDLNGKNPTLVIESIELVEFDNDNGKETKPAISFVGAKKSMVLNATNTEKLVRKFGADSNQWSGKSVMLGTEYYAKFDRDGLILTALDTEDPNDDIPF